MPALLIATLDTKGEEIQFIRERLHRRGIQTLILDAGSLGVPAIAPDIDRSRVFEAGGTSLDTIREKADRGAAVAAAAQGTAALARELHGEGRLDGVLAVGGSAGTTIGTAAMRGLPIGLPKVMVSTLASGSTRPYVGGSDLALFPAVADIAGLNRLSRMILANAADALAGMIEGRKAPGTPMPEEHRPIVAATMFGVTTPCVAHARRLLEAAGCEVIVFHATGVGGEAMERMIEDGQVEATLDITTTELADELVGGVLSAGPDRLQAAGRRGIPQVVSLGALDMVNFGPRATVPERFATRLFHHHNPTVTLMRTTVAENRELGRRIAAILSRARGPTVLMIPRGGVSGIDRPGQPFFDPEADAALFETVASELAGVDHVRVVSRPENINDPPFAEEAANQLLGLMRFRSERADRSTT